MILGFKKYFSDGTLTDFVIKILARQKIHTIREDKHKRWRKGMVIHFATGVRTKNYNCFLIGRCQSVQNIQMEFYKTQFNDTITIDNHRLTYDELERLALNDGFNGYSEFRNWFINDRNPTDIFIGRIIHWTKHKY